MGMPKQGLTLVPDGWCVGHVLMLVEYVFSMFLVHMCLLHPCCVGHGGSGFAMEVLMLLLSTRCHKCMIGYALLFLMYCSCMLSYMFLHIVHAFLFYARSHIVNAFMFSMYAFLCEVIC